MTFDTKKHCASRVMYCMYIRCIPLFIRTYVHDPAEIFNAPLPAPRVLHRTSEALRELHLWMNGVGWSNDNDRVLHNQLQTLRDDAAGRMYAPEKMVSYTYVGSERQLPYHTESSFVIFFFLGPFSS